MKGRRSIFQTRAKTLLGLCALLAISLEAPGWGLAQEAAVPADAAIEQHANALLQQMTVTEKVGQLTQLASFGASDQIMAKVRAGEVGSLFFLSDPALINKYQHIAVDESRMHIPLLIGFDVVHGFTTAMP